MYWAEALAEQSEDLELQNIFSQVAADFGNNENEIIQELNGVQGKATDIGGYYFPNPELTEKVMRPSATLNAILAGLA
jgi:isocitrate dehydrogenase